MLTDQGPRGRNLLLDGPKLGVQAVVLDTVVFVSEVLHPPHMAVDDIAQVWRAIAHFNVPNPYPPLRRLHAFLEIPPADVVQGDLQAWRRDQAAYLLGIHQKSGEAEATDSQYWEATVVGGDGYLFSSLIPIMLRGNGIFLAQHGYMGTAHGIIGKGDQWGIIFGCKTISILRNMDVESTSHLLGEVYVVDAKLQVDREAFR
ncbi:hypothetical protein QQS21_010224 [Conoideocrella luteorostrata]|uniref:Uncharacterized protein n=1 Tax=Conoideocrella luteorostrata TaxID=1105319 RepID=A0AAJ0CFG3_9HYPO|nr:hypothetical protein QQS21_010224 [Conoideocrella luteorostrata]